MRWLVAALTAAALVAAPPAAAQTPISLGSGEAASVVADAAGTAHIAFDSGAGSTYCRLPRKARACDVRSFLPLEGAQSPFIRERADGVLFLLVSAENVLYLRTSPDRGVTWSAPAAIGAGTPVSAELAPGGQGAFTLGYGNSVVNFRHAPFAGGEMRVLNLLFGDEPPSSADMVLLRDGRLAVIFGDGEHTRWRLFGGGDVYDINAWAASGTVAGVSGAELVTGPRGTYLFDHRSLAAQRTGSFAAPFALRSLDTRRVRWRRARAFGADRSIFGSSTAIQDARGRLHVVADTPGAGLTTCVLYTRTSTRRSSWFGKTTVLFRTRENDRTPQVVRVGAAPDGRGFAVWQDKVGEMWATPLRQARGKYRPRANQNDRPACVGRRYS
jgi:hypothetical protein